MLSMTKGYFFIGTQARHVILAKARIQA